MKFSLRLVVCLVVLLTTEWTLAQEGDAVAETTSAPVAHIYINSGSKILAYSAASTGKLTAISGSPFNLSTQLMGSNGHFLFGFEPGTEIVDSLSMSSTGALKKSVTTDMNKFWQKSDCPLVSWAGQAIRVDHSGLSFYNSGIPDDVFCRMNFQSYRIDDSKGELIYQGQTDDVFDGGVELDVLGNNKFAIAPECTDFDAPGPHGMDDNNYHGSLQIYQRLSNGELADISAKYSFPTAPNDNSDPTQPSPGFYCPITAATDPTNHIALMMNAIDQNLAEPYGPGVIAVYTADSHGNLTTTSTYKNMPQITTGSVLRMAPSGKLLAAGGSGIEILHFNGASPITPYKTILTGNLIQRILWDNANHMYALGSDSKGNGKLWVYTVTPTSVTQAPGSPYSIANEGGMIVQPLK